MNKEEEEKGNWESVNENIVNQRIPRLVAQRVAAWRKSRLGC